MYVDMIGLPLYAPDDDPSEHERDIIENAIRNEEHDGSKSRMA